MKRSNLLPTLLVPGRRWRQPNPWVLAFMFAGLAATGDVWCSAQMQKISPSRPSEETPGHHQRLLEPQVDERAVVDERTVDGSYTDTGTVGVNPKTPKSDQPTPLGGSSADSDNNPILDQPGVPVVLRRLTGAAPNIASAEPPGALAAIVPGTGLVAEQVGDDFEDEQWACTLNLPKSSQEQDGQQREPGAYTSNKRWYEGAERGVPDQVQRIQTPAGGIPGSSGALLLRSLQTGVPGQLSYKNQQDDFVCNVHSRLGGSLPVSQSPNVVVRVFFPPLKYWEQRQGAHFGFRLSLSTHVPQSSSRFASHGSVSQRETYWPGMFVDLVPASVSESGEDQISLRIRSNDRGYDFPAIAIDQLGWWTLGISVTPDGRVHYFAKPGVDALSEADHIVSQTPYNFHAQHMKTFFFNIVNGDDGKNWSTPMIIDDPTLFYLPAKQPNTK